MMLRWVFVGLIALFTSNAVADGDVLEEELPGDDTEETEVEDMALLQQKTILATPKTPNYTAPYLIPLRRELSPVIRMGKVVSHRASYSGVINVGSPVPKEFRVVFDTGSAHVVLPSMDCWSSACLKHVRYDIRASESGEAIYLDGRTVPKGRIGESVTIGFGTAKVTGDFVRERICFGPVDSDLERAGPCVKSQAVMATSMSSRPFDQFKFDGIVGLGMPPLALNKNFSLFDHFANSGNLAFPYFSFFLAEGDDGEASEIAIGGHNPKHMLEPLSWVPMAKPELGYWQVKILAVHVDGVKMDMCDEEDDCHGILDSGTSHLGIPSSSSEKFNDLLTRPSGDLRDCRRVHAPVVRLELSGLNITLHPENYMRLLPVPADVLGDANVTVSPGVVLQDSPEEQHNSTAADNSSTPEGELLCTPKLLPVSWPAPVGPNVFILGEPVLQRYYTVFDWAQHRTGFALASHLRTPAGAVRPSGADNAQPPQDEIVLLQVTLSVTVARA